MSVSYLADVNPSVPQTNKVATFTPYERKGVAIMAAAGVISCTLVSTLLLYIVFSGLYAWSQKKQDRSTTFASKQIAVFVICLLVSDLIQSFSGITQVKWAIENRIYNSRACSIQAATLVMGDIGSTVWSCVIAAHTFNAITLGKQWSHWVVWTIVCMGWTYVIILTFVPPIRLYHPDKGSFFSIAGTWCFISSEYAVPRLVIHYVPLFVAAAIIVVFYVLIFLVLNGTVKWSRIGDTSISVNSESHKHRIAIAKRMLWYPVAYLTCILPIAVSRLVGFKEETIPEAVWIFGMFFLFFLGAVDSVIYATTRRVIRPINLPLSMARLGRKSSVQTIGFESTSSGREHSLKFSENSQLSRDALEEEQSYQKRNSVGQPTKEGIHITFERIQEVM